MDSKHQTATTGLPLLTPELIAARAGQAPRRVRLPAATVFADRAVRLRELAAGHALRDYLVAMAQLAEAQDAALAREQVVAIPDLTTLQASFEAGEAPLRFPGWDFQAGWLLDLRAVLDALAPSVDAKAVGSQGADSSPFAAVVHDLRAALLADETEGLCLQAERLLTGVMHELDLAVAPILGAALQVYWVRLVAATQAAYPDQPIDLVGDSGVCLCCGSVPVASVAQLDADTSGLRYLHCHLCQTQWHRVRIKCAHCDSTAAIRYEQLVPQADDASEAQPRLESAVRAECCGDCGHYLKLFDRSKALNLDPIADDLASVTLDLLLAQEGWQRHGVNMLLIWGEPPDEGDARTRGSGGA